MPAQKLAYVWSAKREGNLGFVRELCTLSDGTVEYDRVYEMPSNVVPAFIAARRRITHYAQLEAGNQHTAEESGTIN
jgi:hypothetical protein